MNIRTYLEFSGDKGLEGSYSLENKELILATSGRWSGSCYHGGEVNYFVVEIGDGVWGLELIQYNRLLADLDEEDVADGDLTDEQAEAIGDRTLAEAQAEEEEQGDYCRTAAVIKDAPADMTLEDAATLMYDRVVKDGGMFIEEPEGRGLIDA